MPFYSANGQTRPLMVGPDGNLITAPIQPNASQFGWTSSDLSSVTDLVVWVSKAQDAATSASQNAEYVEEVYNEILDVQLDVKNIQMDMIELDGDLRDFVTATLPTMSQAVTDTQAASASATLAYNNVVLMSNWVSTMYDNIRTMYDNLQTGFPAANLPDAPGKPPQPIIP